MLLFTDKHQKADTGGWWNRLFFPPAVLVRLCFVQQLPLAETARIQHREKVSVQPCKAHKSFNGEGEYEQVQALSGAVLQAFI